MKVKFGLCFKFALWFLALIGLTGLAAMIFLYRNYTELIRNQRIDYAVSVGQIVSAVMDGKDLSEYAAKKNKDSQYEELIRHMQRIQRNAEVYYLYVVATENEEEGVYIFDLKLEGGESVLNHSLGEKNPLKENYPGLSEMFTSQSSEPIYDEVEIGGEGLDSIYIPMRNEDGDPVGFVGIDFMDSELREEAGQRIRRARTLLFVILGIFFLINLLFVRISILRPIYRLRKHAERVAAGEYDSALRVRGHDELSDITAVFNRMTENIAGHMEEMQKLNDAYFRYVPDKILPLLGKNRIEQVGLGDEVSQVLTVFSFQMADFDRTIRKKSNPEMIDAINQILQVTIPVVAEREGMVEIFQNAGFTALYDGGCEPALQSAIEINQKLNQMARSGELDQNRAAIGISYGEVALGIVGQEKRMEAITVSQYRDMACWLQGIAERYQSHILITQTAAGKIPRFLERFHTRMLGFVYNTYTGHRDLVYDVYDGDSDDETDAKNETKASFEKGVELYCAGDFVHARHQFIAVLKRFRRDRAAKEYLSLCDAQISRPNSGEPEICFSIMD